MGWQQKDEPPVLACSLKLTLTAQTGKRGEQLARRVPPCPLRLGREACRRGVESRQVHPPLAAPLLAHSASSQHPDACLRLQLSQPSPLARAQASRLCSLPSARQRAAHWHWPGFCFAESGGSGLGRRLAREIAEIGGGEGLGLSLLTAMQPPGPSRGRTWTGSQTARSTRSQAGSSPFQRARRTSCSNMHLIWRVRSGGGCELGRTV